MACWPVPSLHVRSDEPSSQCAPVGPSHAWWNDKRNDIANAMKELPPAGAHEDRAAIQRYTPAENHGTQSTA